MKKEMDIEKIKNKRQLNVQEQNRLTQYYIEQEAVFFQRHKNLPAVLLEYFIKQGIGLDQDLLIGNDRMSYGGPIEAYRGQWLTRKHRFISYVIFLNETDTQIDEVEEWEDRTDEVEINAHTKGYGHSFGQLCIHVLNKINNT